MGAPKWPPSPHPLGAPRLSRGAPRNDVPAVTAPARCLRPRAPVAYDPPAERRFGKTDGLEVIRMRQRIKAFFRRRSSVLGFVLAVLVLLAEVALAVVVFS